MIASDVAWYTTLRNNKLTNDVGADILGTPGIECLQYSNTSNILDKDKNPLPPVDCNGILGRHTLELYSSGDQNSIFYKNNGLDADGNAVNWGFLFNGQVCQNNDPNLCPLRVNLFWEPICDGQVPCYEPTIQISVEFDLVKNKIGPRILHFNREHYNFVLERQGGI